MTRQVSRRILQEIQLDKIAAVDRPCQEGAIVTIMKRAEPEADSAEKVRANRVSELRKKLLTAKTGMAVLNTLIAKATPLEDDELAKAGEGARRAGEAHQRRGEHFGPPRPRTGRSNPPKGAHGREDHGPRRGKQSGRRGAALARSGNLEMGATSANVGFGAGRSRKLKQRKRPKHLKGKASFAIKRRPLQSVAKALPGQHVENELKSGKRKRIIMHGRRVAAHDKVKESRKLEHAKRAKPDSRRHLQKDQIGRVQALIAKSSILLAQCGDVEDRIRKVIGDSAAEYIHDFVNSTNSRFEGKSKQDRIRMALGAYYSNR